MTSYWVAAYGTVHDCARVDGRSVNLWEIKYELSLIG